jgi:hypothetical protein
MKVVVRTAASPMALRVRTRWMEREKLQRLGLNKDLITGFDAGRP